MMTKLAFAEFFEDKFPKSIAISHKNYLVERCLNRKLYIYGIGDVAVSLKKYLEINNIKINFFIDDSCKEHIIDDIEIIQSIDIIYKEANSFFIILANDSENYGISRRKFLDMGLSEDIDFTYHTEIPGTNELFHYDVTLSFSRIRQKYQGFEVYGDESNPDAVRIVALGGSTTECSLFYVKGWVQFFVEYLQKKGIPAVVYGGGVSSYISSQELLKLIRDVIPLNPDIVLSYSGVNDLYSFPNSDEPYRYRRPFITRFQIQFIQQILERLTQGIGIPVVNAPSWNKCGHTTVYYGLQNDKTASKFWIDNMRMMNAVSKTFGISFFSFFQPFRFNGCYTASKTQEIIHCRRDLTCVPTAYGEKHWGIKVKDELYKIRDEINKYDFISDLSDIFKNQNNIYYDTTHVYEKGNEIIATKILETIIPFINSIKPRKKYPTIESSLISYSPIKKINDQLEGEPLSNAINFFLREDLNVSSSSTNLKVGDIIHFGKYNWIVLNATADYALILSENIIEISDYHGSLNSITWEHCDLRKKLNTTFFNTFNNDEKKRILPALVLNKDNPKYNSVGGNDTVDNIFILSIYEVERYLSNCIERVGRYNNKTIWWWLRTPGIYSDRAMAIHNVGHPVFPGYYIKSNKLSENGGIRPTLLLSLKK